MDITPEMEIVRERILSLIPRNEDGKFVHGALKSFANSIGLKSGNLISDWVNSRSHSYMNYLYEIAAKYNVSVEWLKGETDEKNPPPKVEGDHAIDYVDDELKEYLDELRNRPEMRMLFSTTKNATKAQIEAIVKFIEGLEQGR